jgi:hypothetical protein
MGVNATAPSGIDFNKTFGNQNNSQTSGSNARGDQPKAQFWLNIGYTAPGAGDEGEDRFVALPVGIPLDTQEHATTNSRNDSYREFVAAKNDLLDQVMEAAKGLNPGEDRILNLQIQLRRVAGEQAPVEPGKNRFAVPLSL